MPRGVSHDGEFARIASHEHNPSKGPTSSGFGPSKRFPNKGQMTNPTSSGGINRPTKGKGKSGKTYSKSAQ